MVSASVGRVVEITVREGERLGLPRLRSELSQEAQPVFSFDPSSETVLSSSPLLRDPYEDQVLAVRQSSLAGAGRGVFARADISNNTVVGYFNGVHRAKSAVFLSLRKSAYLVQGPKPGEMLDIPAEFQDWNNYQASTGHLINHSQEGNILYMECHHPRFGHILCVVTTRDIQEGEELFVTVRSETAVRV